jgi:hypothetical protein
VEGGVEAGDLGDAGIQVLNRPDGSDRRWVVEGGQVAQPIEAVIDGRVETNGPPKLAPPVHDPMADGIDAPAGGDEPTQRPIQMGVAYRRQIIASLHVEVGVEEPELEAARA